MEIGFDRVSKAVRLPRLQKKSPSAEAIMAICTIQIVRRRNIKRASSAPLACSDGRTIWLGSNVRGISPIYHHSFSNLFPDRMATPADIGHQRSHLVARRIAELEARSNGHGA